MPIIKRDEIHPSNLKIGDLREAIKDLPDDAFVLIERVDKDYYDKADTEIITQEGYGYYIVSNHNKVVDKSIRHIASSDGSDLYINIRY